MKLNEFIFRCETPLVFKGILKPQDHLNTATQWTMDNLSDLFKAEKFTFRIGKISSEERKF